MTVGDRAAKRRELLAAIEDSVQRKRAIASDGENPERTAERVAQYREQAARMTRQADAMEANAADWQSRYRREDEETTRLRAELAALQKQATFDGLSAALAAFAQASPEELAALVESRPDLAPLVAAMTAKQDEGRAG
jgi:chromosome segregation ATPase